MYLHFIIFCFVLVVLSFRLFEFIHSILTFSNVLRIAVRLFVMIISGITVYFYVMQKSLPNYSFFIYNSRQ